MGLKDKKKYYLQFLLIQSELDVCLHYGGRMRDLFSVPTVQMCHDTYIWYLSNVICGGQGYVFLKVIKGAQIKQQLGLIIISITL